MNLIQSKSTFRHKMSKILPPQVAPCVHKNILDGWNLYHQTFFSGEASGTLYNTLLHLHVFHSARAQLKKQEKPRKTWLQVCNNVLCGFCCVCGFI